MKKVPVSLLFLSGLGILGIAMVLMLALNADRQRELTCAGVKVEFADNRKFVTQADIESYLKRDYGPYIGQRLDSVDLKKVEQILNGKSAIRKTDAYKTPDGLLNIKIYQREPVVRFQKGNLGFYADERGFLFPLQHNYVSDVPVFDGAVPLDFTAGYKGEPKNKVQQVWLSEVLAMVRWMKASRTWAENISQITVEPDGGLVLIPRKGKERFLFGRPVEVEEKFARIEKYYSAILPEKGAGYYSTINVKYHKQIICRK